MQSGYRLKVMFSNQFIVSEWTGENDAKTLRVVENFLENGEKSCVFKRIMLRVEGALEYKKKNNALVQCFVSGCT